MLEKRWVPYSARLSPTVEHALNIKFRHSIMGPHRSGVNCLLRRIERLFRAPLIICAIVPVHCGPRCHRTHDN